MNISVSRSELTLHPDPRRVIVRFFMPGKVDRACSIMSRVVAMSPKEARALLDEVLRRFSGRHRNISTVFEKHYERVREIAGGEADLPRSIPREKRLLIGSYFTMEYSIESAAFYNPSIVEDPYQGNLLPGQRRIILSLRATGEGHISSIVFRSGIINADSTIELDEPGSLVDVPENVIRHKYSRKKFIAKLDEMRVRKAVVQEVMGRLGEEFSYGELLRSIDETAASRELKYSSRKVIEAMKWLATSHYEVSFSYDTAISDRVLFPVSETESNGIEDARFVRFVDGGEVRYYATYTAYNGFTILPKLLATRDFYHFKVMPLHGPYAQNKGMSLFPRKIDGRYAMIGRCDGVNLYLMRSDNINFWPEAQKLQGPMYPWEFVQIGNGGSPIETPEGWLLITHGVGPVRTYGLGISLLDLDDPTKVIGRLREPILLADDEEREGYVPNVVYSCGSMIHNGELIIPYGIADNATRFAIVPVDELMRELGASRASSSQARGARQSEAPIAGRREAPVTGRK